jgi:hypothetical protein
VLDEMPKWYIVQWVLDEMPKWYIVQCLFVFLLEFMCLKIKG